MDTASLEGKTALKEKILALKNRLKAVILTHNYQIPEIQELADFCGDSLELAKISKGLKEKVIYASKKMPLRDKTYSDIPEFTVNCYHHFNSFWI